MPPAHAVQPGYAVPADTHVLVKGDRHCVSGFLELHCVHVFFPSEHIWHVALGPHVVAAEPLLGFVMQSVNDAHFEHPPLVLSWLHTPHFPLLAVIGNLSTAGHVGDPSTQQFSPEHVVHCTLVALHVVHVVSLAVHVPLVASVRQYTVEPV